MKGILGKKIGMTQIFTEHGEVIPVTVVEAGPVVVTQDRKQLKMMDTLLYKLVSKMLKKNL